MTKRLYRSESDKKISGVCGGIAEYLDADPTIVRLVAVAFIIVTGIFPGLLIYIAGILIIPKKSDLPSDSTIDVDAKENKS